MPQTRRQTADTIVVVNPFQTAISSRKRRTDDDADDEAEPATPRRRQNQKRVRFSDVGPSTNTTGLTPFVRQAALGSSRRVTLATTPGRPSNNALTFNHLTPPTTPRDSQQKFRLTPLRQSLTPRTRRQLRRSHLSEEQNALIAEERSEQKQLRFLRVQVAALTWELETQRLSNINVVDEHAMTCTATLEDEIAVLRQRIADQETHQLASPTFTDGTIDFGVANDSDNHSNGTGLRMWDDEGFGGSPAASHHDGATSPMSPRRLSFAKVTNVDAAAQASIPNKEHVAEVCALESAVHRLTGENGKLLESLEKFQTSLSTLGFAAVHEDDDVTASLRSAIRSTRLELERHLPGETACSLENGKALLDSLVMHIRALIGKCHEQSKTIDTHEQIERSLRKNFDTSLARYGESQEILETVNAHRTKLLTTIADLNTDAQALREQVISLGADMLKREAKIADLEATNEDQATSVSRLQAALDSYRADLETSDRLIAQLELEIRQLQTSTTDALNGRRAVEERLSALQKHLGELSQTFAIMANPKLENVTMRTPQSKSAHLNGCSQLSTVVEDERAEDEEHCLEGPGGNGNERSKEYRDSGVEMLLGDGEHEA